MDSESSGVKERLRAFRDHYDKLAAQIGRVIVGHETVIEQIHACLLANGNALLEGVPGIGKTLLVRTLAEVLDLEGFTCLEAGNAKSGIDSAKKHQRTADSFEHYSAL